MKSIVYRKLSEKEKLDLREAIYLLRYGPTKDSRRPKVFASYVEISRTLQLPYNQVQHICRYKYTP